MESHSFSGVFPPPVRLDDDDIRERQSEKPRSRPPPVFPTSGSVMGMHVPIGAFVTGQAIKSKLAVINQCLHPGCPQNGQKHTQGFCVQHFTSRATKAADNSTYKEGGSNKETASPSKDPKEAKSYKNVVAEILSTEKTYVAGLKDVNDNFVNRLTIAIDMGRHAPDVGKEDISAIFSNIQDILRLHQQLYGEIKKLKRDPDIVSKLGNCFLQHTPFFRLYIDYLLQFDKGKKRLLELIDKDQDFEYFITYNERCLTKTLEALLITPVQRIPRYKMLFEDLLKELGKNGEPDKKEQNIKSISAALSLVESIAKQINDAFNIRENQAKVTILSKRIVFKEQPDFTLAKPHRYFVIAQKLKWLKFVKKLLGGTKPEIKECYFILFNDLLVRCRVPASEDKGKITAKRFWALREEGMAADSWTLWSIGQVLGKPVEHNYKCDKSVEEETGFQLVVHNDGQPTGVDLVLYAQTVADKNAWIAAVSSCFKPKVGMLSITPTMAVSSTSSSTSNGSRNGDLEDTYNGRALCVFGQQVGE